ncbi:MAG: carbohydrate kinase family protein [Gammaproteobacteria bacterium]|nr:carbohydrate kinase family protein [Gammaproteobacteria bacterium]
MSLPAVLCVGRVYCDLVFCGLNSGPSPGQEIYADRLSLHTGGGAAITAYSLAKLGHTVDLCAKLPASPFLSIVETDLTSVVDLKYCSAVEQDDPQITVALTGDRDRSFITRRPGKALPDHYTQHLKAAGESTSISHLHIGELATLLDHPDLVTLAQKAGWSVSLDCAWDPDALHSKQALALIEKVDVFLPNESEFKELAAIGLTAETVPVTVIKKGESGAQAFSKNESAEVLAEKVQCMDATGAGDAFNAGFIHAWLQGQSLDRCLVSGNRSGAEAVSHLGGIAV